MSDATQPNDGAPQLDDVSTTQPLEDSPVPAGTSTAKSVVVLNTGDGKGKSTAAFGVMLRGVAMGWNVAVVQFIKSGDWSVGEEKMGRQLGVDWHAQGEGFTWDSDNLDNDKKVAAQGWAKAAELIAAGDHKLVLLDELTYLINWNWLDAQPVIDAIVNRPEHVNVVITGRDAPQSLIDISDTVTEMRKIKHAYDAGIIAKKGIDY